MHVKSAVILCALYFVTMTQSIGLTDKQINIIVNLFEKHEKSTDSFFLDVIVELGKAIGMEDMSAFKYEKGVPDALQLPALLVLLAINYKKTDNWMEESLSSYEVRIIVGMFKKCDQEGEHDGLLKYEEVKKVIDGLNLEKEVKDKIVNTFSEDELAVNAAKLLQAFLIYKPKGTGLDKKQVTELIGLHNNHKKDDHIKPDKIKEFFIALSIVVVQYNDQLYFDPILKRTASLELQELMVVSAEYNTDESIEVVRFSTEVVKEMLWNFDEYDADKNGVIDKPEFEKLAKEQFYYDDETSFFEDFDTDHSGQWNVAQLFMIAFKKYETIPINSDEA